jgi:hypothetical protein
MKVDKNDFTFRNILLFILSSIIFYLGIHAVALEISVLSIKYIKMTWKSDLIVYVLMLLSFYSVFTFKKYSQYAVLAFLTVVALKAFGLLFLNFNKLILALDFLYLLFAFYFFSLWEVFVLSASYNPKFEQIDLEKDVRFDIFGSLLTLENELVAEVCLTNIDDNTCFAMISNEALMTPNFKVIYLLKFSYMGTSFKSKVKIVSKYDRGLGFTFENLKKKDLRSLSGLYKVCLQRGIV